MHKAPNPNGVIVSEFEIFLAPGGWFFNFYHFSKNILSSDQILIHIIQQQTSEYENLMRAIENFLTKMLRKFASGNAFSKHTYLTFAICYVLDFSNFLETFKTAFEIFEVV